MLATRTTLPTGLIAWLRAADFSTRREYLMRVVSHLYCTGGHCDAAMCCKLCDFVRALEVHYVCQ